MITMTQERFNELDDYTKYVVQYQQLLACDDGSYESETYISHWINHIAHNLYGEASVEYYQRMMIQFYDHTPEDFMD